MAIDTVPVKGVRVTPHLYTTTGDLDALVRAIGDLARASPARTPDIAGGSCDTDRGESPMRPHRPAAWLLLALASTALPAHQAGDEQPVDQFLLTRFAFTPAQVAAARRGVAVAVVLGSTVDREVAIGGAVRVQVSPDRLFALLQDVERLESGPGFLRTRRLSEPPRLEDFADLVLPPGDVADLRRCRPGACDVKLGQGAFDLLRQIDWKAPDAASRVNALARRTSLEYVEAYRKGGNSELAIYLDSDRPQFIAAEFAEMVGRARLWPDTLRPLADVLLGYPKAPRPAGMRDFFYWSLAEFGLKPVVRLNQAVCYSTGRPAGTMHAVAIKQLYASHYFHTALEIRTVVNDASTPASGTYLVVLNIARSDGLTGLFGGVVKSKVRTASRSALERALTAIKRMAESPM